MFFFFFFNDNAKFVLYYSEISVLDLVQDRLNVAKSLGADETLLIKRDLSEKENIKLIYGIFDGEPDKTIDASGAESCIRLAILVRLYFPFLFFYKDKDFYRVLRQQNLVVQQFW